MRSRRRRIQCLRRGRRHRAAPHEGAVRGHGTHGAFAPRRHGAVGGFSSPRAPPAGFAPLTAGGWRDGAAATKPVVLPLPSVAGGPKKKRSEKGNGNGGGGGSAPPQPPSNRALSPIARFNGTTQEEQQQFQPVPSVPTCDERSASYYY